MIIKNMTFKVTLQAF